MITLDTYMWLESPVILIDIFRSFAQSDERNSRVGSPFFQSVSIVMPSAFDKVEAGCIVFCKLNITSASTERTTQVVFILSR
jgi:hypothetical protein